MYGELTFRFQRRNFAQLFKKFCDHYFECEVDDQDKRCAPQCSLSNVCEASDRMGKWFAPTAVRPTHGLERTKRPLILLLLSFNKHNRYRLQIQTHTVKYPCFPSAMRPVPHKEELPVLKPSENLTLSDDNSDSDGHGQQGGDNVDCDLTFEASCYTSEPHLLKKEILMTLSMI